MEDKIIKAIEEKLENLKDVSTYSSFDDWRTIVINTLSNVYDLNDNNIKSLSKINSYSSYFDTLIDNTENAKSSAEKILINIMKDIKTFGISNRIDDSKKNPILNINVNQHNNQTQNSSIQIDINVIFDVFKGELRNSELDELKEILESELDEKQKKKNFIDKIKSFGSDVASNILASLMTNPSLYNQINGMF
jgi:hypothetical protein